MEDGLNLTGPWGDVPTWLAAVGTCGAVIVSLYLARQDGLRREQRERRRQAELVTAWLGAEEAVGDQLFQQVVIQNSSSQSVYQLIVSLVSVQGAFRVTAVPPPQSDAKVSDPFQTRVGQVPPGRFDTRIQSGGHGMYLRLGVEIAFQDASGVYWLRRGNGCLEEMKGDPVTVYRVGSPVGWLSG